MSDIPADIVGQALFVVLQLTNGEDLDELLGVRLDVQPSINADGTLAMHLGPLNHTYGFSPHYSLASCLEDVIAHHKEGDDLAPLAELRGILLQAAHNIGELLP